MFNAENYEHYGDLEDYAKLVAKKYDLLKQVSTYTTINEIKSVNNCIQRTRKGLEKRFPDEIDTLHDILFCVRNSVAQGLECLEVFVGNVPIKEFTEALDELKIDKILWNRMYGPEVYQSRATRYWDIKNSYSLYYFLTRKRER